LIVNQQKGAGSNRIFATGPQAVTGPAPVFLSSAAHFPPEEGPMRESSEPDRPQSPAQGRPWTWKDLEKHLHQRQLSAGQPLLQLDATDETCVYHPDGSVTRTKLKKNFTLGSSWIVVAAIIMEWLWIRFG
jgi:hypothetical protein